MARAGERETEKDRQKASQGPSFEEALARLEDIVRRLEGGELSLDTSLELFQEGVALARLCSAKLEEAEARIDQLIEESGGRFSLKPLKVEGAGGATGDSAAEGAGGVQR